MCGCALPHALSCDHTPAEYLQKKPYTVRPRQCALQVAGPTQSQCQPSPTHILSSPHPVRTSPALRILSSSPHPIQPSTHPIQPSALAWQWGGTKRACSVVLVLLVGCVLPGGGASTSPAAPTTGASLEGSSDSSSPGRGLSDSMAKVREREATAALGCLPKVLAAGCPKSQVLGLIMRIGRRPLSSTSVFN